MTGVFNVQALRVGVRRVLLALVGLGRYPKRTILACCDLVLLGLALWLVISLRLGEPYVAPSWELRFLFCAAPMLGVATLFHNGLYRLVTRYIGAVGARRIASSIGLSALFWALLVVLSGVQFAS